MKLRMFQIDAFASKVFEGNPAAVIPLESWIDDKLMQDIATENNLSETVFFVKEKSEYRIRWFTPVDEVDLCGHATLASAYVIFNYLEPNLEKIVFNSKSGALHVSRKDDVISMNFPSDEPVVCEIHQAILDAFSVTPIQVLKAMDYIVVFDESVDITTLEINHAKFLELDLRGVCITCKDKEYDFVSRFFAPKYGISEDSVTGSAYTQLLPYWSKLLNKKSLTSKQVSPRGGELWCELKENRVQISGKAVKFFETVIEF